jgi:hypothetical protein
MKKDVTAKRAAQRICLGIPDLIATAWIVAILRVKKIPPVARYL